MAQPRLSKLELQIMEVLWERGVVSIREIQEAFPEKARPAYTTITRSAGAIAPVRYTPSCGRIPAHVPASSI